jgi:RNA polymerase sigma factor (sigma-70 family)
MMEDTALITGFKAGDHRSFETLMIKYRSPALNFAFRYVKNAFTAEDIVQDSFADLYVYRDRYQKNYSFKTYLFTIVKNKSISHLRKKSHFSINEVELQCSDTPETDYIVQESLNLVRTKISQMKDDYQMVLYLKEYEDFSYAEIAGIMGRSTEQIKILIFRARKKLKVLLSKEA